VLQAQLYNDVAARSRADTRPWRPIPPDPDLSPYAVSVLSDDAALFSVITSASGELAGEALLWGIDLHNRLAHVGLALLPGFRGRGWSAEVLRLLCRYGFVVSGLNRLQLETGAGNTPMLRAAARAGFEEEGTLRQAAWALGSFGDTVVMGLLAAGWPDLASPARDTDRSSCSPSHRIASFVGVEHSLGRRFLTPEPCSSRERGGAGLASAGEFVGVGEPVVDGGDGFLTGRDPVRKECAEKRVVVDAAARVAAGGAVARARYGLSSGSARLGCCGGGGAAAAAACVLGAAGDAVDA
jgi:RimJ/RimL family protein N-acetyltransferase